jgi:septal ring factor EnvC (AmiA/AmiB activator)
MKINVFFPAGAVAAFSLMLLTSCNKNQVKETSFTKVDSLTETYLALQDTMLQAWNSMIHDDNRKLKSMNHLLHELTVSSPEKRDEIEMLEGRLDQLKSLRYNQQTMSDTEVVSEYDFASNSLITELISLAESQKEFAYNTTLQKLVDSIRAADQRVNIYREGYDRVATQFNQFIEGNRAWLNEIEQDSGLKKRPLFGMADE